MFKKTLLGVGLLFAAQAAFAAKTCPFTVEGTDQMKYNVTEIKVPAACTEIQLTLKHVGKMPVQAMGHNWVLAKTPDFMGVVNGASKAGAAKNYLPEGDKRIIAHTKLVGGGQTDTVKFSKAGLTKGGDYTFFCSFPGHFALMKGKFIVE